MVGPIFRDLLMQCFPRVSGWENSTCGTKCIVAGSPHLPKVSQLGIDGLHLLQTIISQKSWIRAPFLRFERLNPHPTIARKSTPRRPTYRRFARKWVKSGKIPMPENTQKVGISDQSSIGIRGGPVLSGTGWASSRAFWLYAPFHV